VQVAVVERVGGGAAEMAHVRADARREADVVTQLPDVRPGLTPDPEERLSVVDLQHVEIVDRTGSEPGVTALLRGGFW